MMRQALVLLSIVLCTVLADVYMHNMRGSNNRLNEANNNRNNANRLFDSQNNERGGYNVGDNFAAPGGTGGHGIMKYHAGSELILEWTNQHGCGVDHPKVRCEIILQYMCAEDANNALWNAGQTPGLRDGTTTNTIDEANPDDETRGRHEPVAWYTQCKTRQRNRGLFIADQNLGNNQDTAIFTRQDNAGTKYGFECPEERDYYPYWHPTPWKDIAILTWNESLCDNWVKESGNVKAKGYCSAAEFNNATACAAGGGTWTTFSWNIAEPKCEPQQWSRDNHLGNVAELDNEMMRYTWTIPNTVSDQCVLRIRYNISTGDYWGYEPDFVDWRFNGKNSPIEDNPTVDFGVGAPGVKLALNTDQYFRTFEDRSHVFSILSPAGGRVHNLNIRGRRGNIVAVYPAVEYDFIPNNLTINAGDRVHIQWTGSTTNPDGTDKNNIVQIAAYDVNYPMSFDTVTMWDIPTAIRFASSGATDGNFDPNLEDRPAYYDGGLVSFKPGTYLFMCTRNNNFSNRSQKGRLVVN